MGREKWFESSRIAAFIVIVALLGATIVFLLLSLRSSADLKQQVSSLDSRITLLSQQTGSRMDALSQDLRDLSQGMQKELASTRRVTAGDVSRMGRGLSGRLDLMAMEMKDLAPSARPELTPGGAEPARLADDGWRDRPPIHKSPPPNRSQWTRTCPRGIE